VGESHFLAAGYEIVTTDVFAFAVNGYGMLAAYT
jgi:hypothetical protein